MRALLIDPIKRSITEINLAPGLEAIYEVMGCMRFVSGAPPLTGSTAEGWDSLYADDTDVEDRGDPRDWYQLDTYRNPPSSWPLCGRGLVVGVNPQGELCDARISLAQLKSRITFRHRGR